MSDLRESGAIEQDADIVTFIYRPGYYGVGEEASDVPSDLTEIILAKHRNGGLGTVNLRFLPHFVKFEDPGDGGFDNDVNDVFNVNPFGPGGIITRPSKMNADVSSSSTNADTETPDNDIDLIPF